jgi:hypothetical protein
MAKHLKRQMRTIEAALDKHVADINSDVPINARTRSQTAAEQAQGRDEEVDTEQMMEREQTPIIPTVRLAMASPLLLLMGLATIAFFMLGFVVEGMRMHLNGNFHESTIHVYGKRVYQKVHDACTQFVDAIKALPFVRSGGGAFERLLA